MHGDRRDPQEVFGRRPVNMIVDAAKRIMQGDFSVRIPKIHSRETSNGFDVIADYFNQMAKELSGTETLRTDSSQMSPMS